MTRARSIANCLRLVVDNSLTPSMQFIERNNNAINTAYAYMQREKAAQFRADMDEIRKDVM